MKKYLQAARGVADHLVLKPTGFDFAPHPVLAETDRDKYCILRIIDFPPEPHDADRLKQMLDSTFGGIYQDALHDQRAGKHPGMHRTETVDYAIVLEGEIWAVMDEGETLLRAGDVLIQRGTNHAWANRSQATARIAFVLIDGRR